MNDELLRGSEDAPQGKLAPSLPSNLAGLETRKGDVVSHIAPGDANDGFKSLSAISALNGTETLISECTADGAGGFSLGGDLLSGDTDRLGEPGLQAIDPSSLLSAGEEALGCIRDDKILR